MGEYTLTPEDEASVKIIQLFKQHWPENEGQEIVNALLKILYDLTERRNLILKEGETKITDEQGNILLQVELTPNMIVVLGVDGTPLLRSWRDILKFWAPPLQPPFEASGEGSQAPEIAEGEANDR